MTDEAKGVEAAARAAHSVVTGATPNPVAWESLSVLEQCSWIAAMRAALAQPKEGQGGQTAPDWLTEQEAKEEAERRAFAALPEWTPPPVIRPEAYSGEHFICTPCGLRIREHECSQDRNCMDRCPKCGSYASGPYDLNLFKGEA